MQYRIPQNSNVQINIYKLQRKRGLTVLIPALFVAQHRTDIEILVRKLSQYNIAFAGLFDAQTHRKTKYNPFPYHHTEYEYMALLFGSSSKGPIRVAYIGYIFE